MITVYMKDGNYQTVKDGTVDRDGSVLMVYNEDGLVAEFNDTWSHWYEKDIDSGVLKEE